MAEFTAVIAEDNQGLRALFRQILEEQTQCSVVSEAADGLQAVQQAEEFQPDLILLDLALPKMNGMEACRRIRKVAPNAKIVFLSQNTSPEVVQEALRAGALGYLLKSEATDLPIALTAVLQGTQFVSNRLKRK